MKAHILAAAALVALATPALAQGIDSKHSPYPASAYAGYAGDPLPGRAGLPVLGSARGWTGRRIALTFLSDGGRPAPVTLRRHRWLRGLRHRRSIRVEQPPRDRDATRRPRRGVGGHIRPLQKRAAGRWAYG
jgi:hypothetical protein